MNTTMTMTMMIAMGVLLAGFHTCTAANSGLEIFFMGLGQFNVAQAGATRALDRVEAEPDAVREMVRNGVVTRQRYFTFRSVEDDDTVYFARVSPGGARFQQAPDDPVALAANAALAMFNGIPVERIEVRGQVVFPPAEEQAPIRVGRRVKQLEVVIQIARRPVLHIEALAAFHTTDFDRSGKLLPAAFERARRNMAVVRVDNEFGNGKLYHLSDGFKRQAQAMQVARLVPGCGVLVPPGTAALTADTSIYAVRPGCLTDAQLDAVREAQRRALDDAARMTQAVPAAPAEPAAAPRLLGVGGPAGN